MREFNADDRFPRLVFTLEGKKYDIGVITNAKAEKWFAIYKEISVLKDDILPVNVFDRLLAALTSCPEEEFAKADYFKKSAIVNWLRETYFGNIDAEKKTDSENLKE